MNLLIIFWRKNLNNLIDIIIFMIIKYNNLLSTNYKIYFNLIFSVLRKSRLKI